MFYSCGFSIALIRVVLNTNSSELEKYNLIPTKHESVIFMDRIEITAEMSYRHPQESCNNTIEKWLSVLLWQVREKKLDKITVMKNNSRALSCSIFMPAIWESNALDFAFWIHSIRLYPTNFIWHLLDILEMTVFERKTHLLS